MDCRNSSNVYVVWADDTCGPTNIFFAASINAGQIFSTPKNISNSGGSNIPEIALSGNNVYVIWIEFLPFNDEIFFAVSPDKGQTFNEPLNLSQTPGVSSTPQIATP